jgi:hypothetical protein
MLRTNASGKPTSFEDLLFLMGKPTIDKEGYVTLQDFETIVRAVGGYTKFTA